jgi:hypothetical protein
MSQSGSFGSGSGPTDGILTLTGDTGGAVSPDGGGNIDIVGGPAVTVVGDPGTFTLTINVAGAAEATVTTTDATPTLLYALPLLASQAVEIEVSIIAGQSDYSTAIGGKFSSVGRRAAMGGAVVCGSPQGNLMYDSAGNPTVTFTASGNNINISVTGVAATTYNWRGVIRTTYNV